MPFSAEKNETKHSEEIGPLNWHLSSLLMHSFGHHLELFIISSIVNYLYYLECASDLPVPRHSASHTITVLCTHVIH